jgi:hypothetical protein
MSHSVSEHDEWLIALDMFSKGIRYSNLRNGGSKRNEWLKTQGPRLSSFQLGHVFMTIRVDIDISKGEKILFPDSVLTLYDEEGDRLSDVPKSKDEHSDKVAVERYGVGKYLQHFRGAHVFHLATMSARKLVESREYVYQDLKLFS